MAHDGLVDGFAIIRIVRRQLAIWPFICASSTGISPRRPRRYRSVLRQRSRPCRRSRPDATCARTGVSGRVSPHPTRLARTALARCCRSPDASGRLVRPHAFGLQRRRCLYGLERATSARAAGLGCWRSPQLGGRARWKTSRSVNRARLRRPSTRLGRRAWSAAALATLPWHPHGARASGPPPLQASLAGRPVLDPATEPRNAMTGGAAPCLKGMLESVTALPELGYPAWLPAPTPSGTCGARPNDSADRIAFALLNIPFLMA